MNLQTTTNAGSQTGINEPMPGFSAPPMLPERTGKYKGRGTAPHSMPDLRPDTDMVEDAGLGAMTGLGMAMIFNAGLALAGVVGWEIWTMFR